MTGTFLFFVLMIAEVAAIRNCYKYSTVSYSSHGNYAYFAPSGQYLAYTCDNSLSCCGGNTCCIATKYCYIPAYQYYKSGSRHRYYHSGYGCESDKACCGTYGCCSLEKMDATPSAGIIFGGMFGGLLVVVIVSTIASCFMCKGCYGNEKIFCGEENVNKGV